MTGLGSMQPSATPVAPAVPVAPAWRTQALPRSPFSGGRVGPLRQKPRFSALHDLMRLRSGKGSTRPKRKGKGGNDSEAVEHQAHERQIALEEQRGAQGKGADDRQVAPASQARRDTEPFTWLDRLLGVRRLRSGATAAAQAQGDAPSRAQPGFDRHAGQQAGPDTRGRTGISDAWDAGIFPHLLKLGLVSGSHWRATLFGHMPHAAAGLPAPARLLRRTPDDHAASSSPVSQRLRGLLGGMGQWKAGLRGLLRGVASLLNGARAVLGYWFEAGRFHAAGVRAGVSIGVRAWVFP